MPSGTNVKRMLARTAKRKQDRLEAGLTPEAKKVLRRAASIERKTVSAFVLDKGLAAAAETMVAHREFRLSVKRHDACAAGPDAP